MSHIWKWVFHLILIESILVNWSLAQVSTVARTFEENGIVPDVVSKAPDNVVKLKYPSGAEVDNGNVLTPTEVKDTPSYLSWGASPDALYTLVMIDPDAPSRMKPIYREWDHWIVVNIPGEEVTKGETLAAYVGAGPPPKTGFHRYVFLVYKQLGKIVFDEPRLFNNSTDNRSMFSVSRFAHKYNLGDPIAGNFFQAEYDDYVPILIQQLTSRNINSESCSVNCNRCAPLRRITLIIVSVFIYKGVIFKQH